MRVLVAEDDRGLREVLTRGLRENGYVVDAVADGKAAMQFLRSYEYAIAVLDWRMPDVTGLEVLQWMRRRESPAAVLCSRHATRQPTGSSALTREPMTIWSSPSISASCWPVCGRCSAGHARCKRRNWLSGICVSTRPREKCA